MLFANMCDIYYSHVLVPEIADAAVRDYSGEIILSASMKFNHASRLTLFYNYIHTPAWA